ncbi:MAG: hypothetical protein FD136_501 [Chitinophagaceae bacterium]|nr:MAG: hypothetical protein FD136_501 [Chitinophagaceae bacterium]
MSNEKYYSDPKIDRLEKLIVEHRTQKKLLSEYWLK